MIAMRRVRCGSSVYVQKKSSCSLTAVECSALTLKPRGVGLRAGSVAVETEDRIFAVVATQQLTGFVEKAVCGRR